MAGKRTTRKKGRISAGAVARARKKATRRKPRNQPTERRVKILSNVDLGQFVVRKGAIDQASNGLAMMKIGFKVWADEIRERYSLAGPFDVDMRTGELREKANDG